MFIDIDKFSDAVCDSDMLQAAVDNAEASGEAVLIPHINPRTGKEGYEITKTVFLPDYCTVYLNNCCLRLADGAVCSVFRNKNTKLPNSTALENRQYNITVKGIGRAVLDGGKHNGIYENNGIARKVMKPSPYSPQENCMIQFRNVENLTIDGITVKDQRYWGIFLFYVSNSHISNIRYISSGNVPNQDGLDICRGCHDIFVENISGCTGDNLIAICSLGVSSPQLCGDIYNISVRNIIGYGVGGNALIRLLNHDGNKLYNISIDTVIEASAWSDDDAAVAPNPDLLIRTDDEGNILPWKRVEAGEFGYRIESLIQIGEAYWYSKFPAAHGDTYGITVRNIMTHARFALLINHTLTDSVFENIRVFGNGFMAAFFGEGKAENITLRNVTFDRNCHPLPDDRHICIEWNNTRSDGLHCIGFNGTELKNIKIDGLYCAGGGCGMESVFGGRGNGVIELSNAHYKAIPLLNEADGVYVSEEK